MGCDARRVRINRDVRVATPQTVSVKQCHVLRCLSNSTVVHQLPGRVDFLVSDAAEKGIIFSLMYSKGYSSEIIYFHCRFVNFYSFID